MARRFRKKRDCTIRVAKTKALISFAVTAKLICVFVFAYAKSRFSHNEAQLICDSTSYIMAVDSILSVVQLAVDDFEYEPRHEKTNVLVFDLV